jgi:RimJ/RimL family protein N-acetyltransferase
LNAALFERSILSDQVPMVFWTCDPGDWGGQLAVVFDPLPPIWFARNHYVARQAHYDWRSALPAGFAVERIDQALQLRPDRAGPLGLAFPPDIAATLDKWSRMEREGFTARGFSDFGFVTLDVRSERPMIASWATVDFIVDGRGDLGFFTQPDYRRMGLGTIAAAAALEHGFRSGLQQVNWTCDADNLGSSRTAQNLGLERIEDYQMCFLMFDEKQHMQVLQQFA